MNRLNRVLCLLVVSLSTAAFSQSDAQKSAAPPAAPRPQSDAQKSFDQLKTLAGNWKGQGPEGPIRVLLRVTSGGTALLQEMVPEGRPDDPANGDDDPITMLYIDGNRLILTMYCDSGKNRPRMAGRLLPDGKTVEFDFLDVSGGTKYGVMNHAVFTVIDTNHHTEEWTYTPPRGKPLIAHIDLHRQN